MQGKPSPARIQPGLDRSRFGFRRQDIAGVGHQQRALPQPLDIGKIHCNRRADARLVGKKLQYLQPGKINVMIFAGGNEVDLERACHAFNP